MYRKKMNKYLSFLHNKHVRERLVGIRRVQVGASFFPCNVQSAMAWHAVLDRSSRASSVKLSEFGRQCPRVVTHEVARGALTMMSRVVKSRSLPLGRL